MTNIEMDLEDSVAMMNRANDLISLVLEFLDDLPNPDKKEEQWKLVTFNRRADMLRSLIYSVDDAIDQAKGIVKQTICESEVA